MNCPAPKGPEAGIGLIALLRVLRGLQRELGQQLQALARQQAWHQRGVEIAPSALVRLGPGAVLEIGRGTVIGPYSILDLLPDPLVPAPSPSRIQIGSRVAINEFCNLRAGGGEISVGDGCLIAQFVSIVASNHSIAPSSFIRDQPWDMSKRTVVIGEDVWIGAHAVILPGVRVGSGSVIAAGAVVTTEVHDKTIGGGVPARAIGYRK